MKKTVYIIIGLLFLALGVAGAFVSLKLTMAAILGMTIVALILLDFEVATYIVALYVILDYGIRTYLSSSFLAGNWDELLFICCMLLWFYKWFVYRREKPYKWTPLEFPLLFFIGTGIFIMLMNTPSLHIGVEGFRAVFEYILWFFVIVQLLRTPTGAKRVIYVMVLIGTALGLHGVYQYVTHVPVPLTWIDRAEIGVTSRAFSIMGNSNALASLMLLFIPLSISLVFFERKISKKIIFGITALIMTACLVFTLTRSAWIAFALALMIFVFLTNKRFFIPFVILFAVAAVLVAVFIPSVYTRITYLLSPAYIASSSTGGRIYRWGLGLKKFSDSPWFGVGFGRFGGAVAANNKIPGTIYMDNYYLKILVESGVVGFSAFALLVYNILIWGLRAVKSLNSSRYGHLARGLFAGLCGVLFQAFAENVFEVPAVTACFWMIAGLLMYLWYSGKQGLFGAKEQDNSSPKQ